jgi:hypothetical protein
MCRLMTDDGPMHVIDGGQEYVTSTGLHCCMWVTCEVPVITETVRPFIIFYHRLLRSTFLFTQATSLMINLQAA